MEAQGHGEVDSLSCPACRRRLRATTIAGVTIDVCADGCAGIWFDQHELRSLAAAGEAADRLLTDIASHVTDHPDLSARRRCPRCPESVLMRHFSSPSRAVTIDECPTCAGVWLDGGELERIRAEHATHDDRRRAMQQFFEIGAVDERMDLIRQQLDAVLPYDTTRSRMASSLLVALYVVSAFPLRTVGPASALGSWFGSAPRSDSALTLFRVLRFCAVPVACIWFPDALGVVSRGRLKPSHRAFVWFFGWVVLLLPVIMTLIVFAEGVR